MAAAAALFVATAGVASDGTNRSSADRRQATAQTASFGGSSSPVSVMLTVGLVLTGAVVALGAWNGDAAETP